MNIEKSKVTITRRILETENKVLLQQVEKLLDQYDWQGVSDQEISAIEEGLQALEADKTVPQQESNKIIDKLFENYKSKNA